MSENEVSENDELSELERLKEESDALRSPLKEELADSGPAFTEAGRQVLKFHGVYQQDDRDTRRERKRAGEGPEWSMMVRSKIPGGVLTADQYLAHDELAGRFGNGTLRITTRQGIQLHGVPKGELRSTIRALDEALVTTLGACGDVERNVLSCPAPVVGGARAEALEVVRELSRRTLPSGGAYHEIWLNGERVAGGPRSRARPGGSGGASAEGSAEEPAEDPLYGRRYLPRKFKTAVAFEDDNCTDALSNDLGFVATVAAGGLEGFEVFVGGGLGMTHNKPETFPRLADPLTWIRPEDAVAVAEAVIRVQRDHGNRSNRRRARLKYLIHERGLDWFRTRVEEEYGGPLAPPRGVAVREVRDHVGWHPQGDGRWYFGIHVENGRIADGDRLRLRTALRELASTFGPGVHLTPQQNLILTDVADGARHAFAAVAASYGLGPDRPLTTVRRWAMACPALPTCGLALTESERVMPDVVTELEGALREVGLEDERFTVRMTGCPNGCARPYTAEIGFVGRGRDKYTVFVGGDVKGDHLGFEVADLVPRDRLVATVRPLLDRYRELRAPDEGLGAFTRRVGADAVEAWIGGAP